MFSEQHQLFDQCRAVRHDRETALCTHLLAGTLLFATATAIVEAAPSGGQVTRGAADIKQNGAATVIEQASNRVDIDWTSFDTTATESVNFEQPGSSALAVNRISGNRTQFDGTLTANGRIFLINQNGITFGASAQINTGALLATTAELDDSTSTAETFNFSGDGYASVVNNGNITVSDGGFAVLAAPAVENTGFIKADLGQIELASTQDYTVNVDLRGDDLITFEAPGELLDTEQSPGVSSSGTLQARSGQVYLSANMASQIVAGVVNLNGIVDADQFVATPAGGTAMVADAAYPGGTIKVESVGDINIGAGADIHASGGDTVSAVFLAERDINVGSADAPATITLQAGGTAADAAASASLEMLAASNGGAGTLNLEGATIEVTADAGATAGGSAAAASVILEGADVEVDADITVQARAQTPATGNGEDADALAVLDVFANGEIEYDTSHNVIAYGEPGDLALTGDIDVGADASGPGSSRATANTVLAATGSTTVVSPVDVYAAATSGPDSAAGDGADANAALVMLGGTPPRLLGLLRDVSLNRVAPLGTLADILTLANLEEVLGFFGTLLDDPAAFVALLGGIGGGDVSYTGEGNVTALADFGTTGSSTDSSFGRAEATAAGYFVAGGDVYINTDPVNIDSQAYADYGNAAPGIAGSASPVDTEARSFLVAAAGLAEMFGAAPAEGAYSELTVLGDLSATATEQATRNGEPDPDQLAAAVMALLATGDITVRGADPLAAAAPAIVQDRASQWQLCNQDQCTPLTPGTDGLEDLAADSASGSAASAHLAQLVIESLYGSIDIQPKNIPTQVQPAGLYTDPIGPNWPGDLPLRFDASGRMLVATGADATRPPQFVALDGSIEAAILAGSDPSALLPATASGGCVAAGRDAFTISGPDYFDRMISASCAEATEYR